MLYSLCYSPTGPNPAACEWLRPEVKDGRGEAPVLSTVVKEAGVTTSPLSLSHFCFQSGHSSWASSVLSGEISS